jgi:hypothetical protein
VAAAHPLRVVAPALPASAADLRRRRITLSDGARTTIHVASFDAAAVELRVAILRGGQRLEPWCAARGVADAIVGGFFTRPAGTPLGEVRTRGVTRRSVPFDSPWDVERCCLHVAGSGAVRIGARHELPKSPRGDLLQAGPLLVRDGISVYDRSTDPEGFSAGAHQFDSDITAERHPRAALGVAGGRLIAVACDGRSRHDAGLTLEELASVLARLGAATAMNLDGGGSTSLIAGGRLVNRPRRGFEVPEPGGRAVATALLFVPAR